MGSPGRLESIVFERRSPSLPIAAAARIRFALLRGRSVSSTSISTYVDISASI